MSFAGTITEDDWRDRPTPREEPARPPITAFDFSLPDPEPEPPKKPGLFDYVPFARMVAACRKIRFAPE